MGEKEKKRIEKTLKLYLGAIVFIFALMISKLTWLQIVNTEMYQTRAEQNRMRLIPLTAPRGPITDRNGKVLVTTNPVFNVSIAYLGLEDKEKVVKKLTEILNDPEITEEYITEQIAAQRFRLYEPIIIKRDVTPEIITMIEERRQELPGVIIEQYPQREYLFNGLAGHLVGYVHSISTKEIEQPEYKDYGLSDLVGKFGVEKQYEQYLRGEKGAIQVEVNSKNKPIREVRRIPAKPGNKVVLTIDYDLQAVMDKTFDELLVKLQQSKDASKAKAGAVIALDVKTGAVLAMSSRPNMFPEDFNGTPLTQDEFNHYFGMHPTASQNRAIQGAYVPGSTFKPITGMAALEAEKTDGLERIRCSGKYWLPPYIKCWDVHGSVDYNGAMAGSCNVYFQEMGRRAGIDEIARVGHEFGLDAKTNIDLPYEIDASSGMNTGTILPTIQWQKGYFSKKADEKTSYYDKRITSVKDEYLDLMTATTDEKERKKLEREMNSKIRSLESALKSELDHYTRWHDWNTYNTSIGQGYTQFSIIQLASYVASLANGGTRLQPYVVEEVMDSSGKVILDNVPKVIHEVQIDQETIRKTVESMKAVTNPGGTAYSLFKNFPKEIKVAAKTGTSQPGRAGYGKTDYDGLFIAFAPADNPQIALAGVVEYGFSGGSSVGVIAKAVFEQYFGLNKVEPQEQPLIQAPAEIPLENLELERNVSTVSENISIQQPESVVNNQKLPNDGINQGTETIGNN